MATKAPQRLGNVASKRAPSKKSLQQQLGAPTHEVFSPAVYASPNGTPISTPRFRIERLGSDVYITDKQTKRKAVVSVHAARAALEVLQALFG